MGGLLRETLRVAGISLAAVFGVMICLYAVIKVMVREKGNQRGEGESQEQAKSDT